MSFTGGRGRRGKALIIAGVIIWAAGLALVGGILRVGAQSRRRLARLVPQLLARLLASLHPHRREHPRRHDDRPGDQASEARSQLHRRPWSVDSAARARLPAARRPARTGLVPRPVGPVPAPLVGRPCLDPAHPVAPLRVFLVRLAERRAVGRDWWLTRRGKQHGTRADGGRGSLSVRWIRWARPSTWRSWQLHSAALPRYDCGRLLV